MRPSIRYVVPLDLPEPLQPLLRLARNLRWTWHEPARDVFRRVSPELWAACGRNPIRMLHGLPVERMDELAGDSGYLEALREAAADLDAYLSAPTWYEREGDRPSLVAYFSPEYGVHEVLPQYSGGLGVLAGDHLKAASDLGVPLVAVGLLYRFGYFRQRLNAAGMQVEEYEALEPLSLPLELVAGDDGAPRLVTIDLPGATLHAQIWRAQVGRVPLLLLDSGVPQNQPNERRVSDRLYGGDAEHRLRQEILLGIGGVRALDALGYAAEVFHTNEGHAGFLGLERIRRLVGEEGLELPAAVETVRAGTVFTTHTPVPAGIDRFRLDLIERYFGPGGVPTGLSLSEVLGFGAEPGATTTAFNMAVMGFRLAGRANGVSRLHGEVSRGMFSHLWPGFEQREVPIGHITNGVHAGTWVAPEWDRVYRDAVGAGYAVEGGDWGAVERVDDATLWAARGEGRRRLVDDVRERVHGELTRRGLRGDQLSRLEEVLDPEALTIGFARRVPSYKRLTLILHERERLRRLLGDRDRPLQLLVAGKAHPADAGGKELIRQFADFALEAGVRDRVLFLPDYDMRMARMLVSGVDVWLNNPLRPMEASGTSGMKSALNGGINLSILDGWWDELYDGTNGWAIASADDAEVADERRDELEARSLLDLLEHDVLPRFYDRDGGVPHRWVHTMKRSITTIAPAVLGSRMVGQYVDDLYTPAARAARSLAADGHAVARDLAHWGDRVRRGWPRVGVHDLDATPDGPHRMAVRAVVSLGDLSPDDVAVEAAYGPIDRRDEIDPEAWTPLAPAGDAGGGAVRYAGTVAAPAAGTFGLAARVVGRHPALATPAEAGLVAWSPPEPAAIPG